MFYNFTNKPFAAQWDKKLYTFQPGQIVESNRIVVSDDGQSSVPLTEAVQNIFAHHLAVSVLNHPELDTNFTYNDKGEAIPQDMKQSLVYNNASITALKARATNPPSADVAFPDSLKRFLDATKQSPVADEPVSDAVVEEAPKKRIGRPKKVEASPSENVEFAISE